MSNRRRGNKNADSEFQKEDEQWYVSEHLEKNGTAVKRKHQKTVGESYRRQYQEEYGKTDRRPQMQLKQQEAPRQRERNEEPSTHFKTFRKDKHQEKHLRSAFGNDLAKSEYNKQYASQNSRQKFNSYKYDEVGYFNNKKSKYGEYGKHRNERSYNENEIQKKTEGYNRKPKFQKERKGNGDFKGYKNYYTEQAIQNGLKNMNLFKGIIVIKEGQRQFAFIRSPTFTQKIMLDDAESQNRATEGAEVIFKIIKSLPIVQDDHKKEENKIKPKISQDYKQKLVEVKVEDNDDGSDWESLDDEEEQHQNSNQKEQIQQKQQPIKAKQIKQESKSLNQTIQDKYADQKLIGEVVGIITDPLLNKDIIGFLEIVKKSLDKPIRMDKNIQKTLDNNFYISFKPINKRYPWFKVKEINISLLNELREGKDLMDAEKLEIIVKSVKKFYFIGKKTEWNRNSFYPDIVIEKKFGEAGDIEIECLALLTEHQIMTDEFKDDCNKEMALLRTQCDQRNEYIIPAEERAKRVDLTKEIICTVDPLTARDLDDALSITEVEDGVFEVGVHIADVSHFVNPDAMVDLEAQQRTTSVYLVHRVIPMLPRVLCENLCSLNPDVERLAFSVFFYIKRNGEVFWDRPIRVSKTIIKSCAKMSYDAVNEMIEGSIKSLDDFPIDKISQTVDRKVLWDKLMLLNEIGQNRRQNRLREGSLTFEKSKLRFQLDQDLYPISYTPEVRKQAQFMVEEWMLLANQFVAKRLIDHNPGSALLRQHKPPQKEKLDYFKRLLKQCKMDSMLQNLDISDPLKLQSTLQEIRQDPTLKQSAKEILSYKLIKLMEPAKYFIVSDIPKDEWHHYALNFDVYTHFTSPIRRYPDILVHRLLQKTISVNENQNEEWSKNLDQLMAKSNQCKLSARRVSDGCEKIFMCLYLKQNPIMTEAFVMDIQANFTTLIMPHFNIEIKKKNEEFVNILKQEVVMLQGTDQSILVLEYQDHEDKNARRLFVLEPLAKIMVNLTSSNSFPIEYHVQIAIPQRTLLNNEIGIKYQLI